MPETTAQVSKVLDATPAEVWKALTTPALLKTYFMGADVQSDWRVGGPIRFRGEAKGKPYEDKGEILAFDAQKRLSFSHWSPLAGKADSPENYHRVDFDLEPQTGATKVTLTQSNLTGGVTPADVKQRAEFEKNWTQVLEGLRKAAHKH